MGKYDKITDAKVTKSGQWFKVGRYKVKIIAVKDVESTKGNNKNFTVIETRVLESNNPEIPVGSERSQVLDMGEVMGFPNLKAFVACASGVDPTLENVNTAIEAYWDKQDAVENGGSGKKWTLPKIVEELIVGLNLLEDVVMDLECVNIKTGKGEDFTKHNWGVRDVREGAAA